jgi:CRP-like cAMP-binding protein
MKYAIDTDLLKSIPAFADLSANELNRIAAIAMEVTYHAGTEIVREGDYSYALMAIVDGTVTVERAGRRVAKLGPGDVFGELGLLDRDLRNATVKAASPLRVVALSHWDLRRIRKANPVAIAPLREIANGRRAVVAA